MSSSAQHSVEVPLWLKFQLTLAVPIAVLRGVFSTTNAQRSWKRAAHVSSLREILSRLSRVDARIAQTVVGGTTANTFRSWATAKQLSVFSEEIDDGGRLHWIGDRQLHKVLLFFHGGGYVLPASPDCFNAILALKEDVARTIGDMGVALLEYSLAPGASFPTQLRQATAALAYLLAQGVSPSSIVLAGDSAGGNLILQLASHILHPLTSLPSPPRLSVPLGGVVLISPWTSYSLEYQSFKTNARDDVLPPSAYAYFAKKASDTVTEETRGHFEPATVASEWWTGFSDITSTVLITMGEKECLFDQIVDLSQSLESHVQVDKVVQVNGVHEDFLFAFGADAQEGRAGNDYKAVLAYLKSVLYLDSH